MENDYTLEKIGEVHQTNTCGELTIIECYTPTDCTVQFEDGAIVKNIRYYNILQGKVRNPYVRTAFGLGYMGGKNIGKNSKKMYLSWKNMFRRCYSEKSHKSYEFVKVCEEWYNFQNFARWFEEGYNLETMKGWHLDKDILIKGNKLYSPESCCLVPAEINSLFIKSTSTRGGQPIGVVYSPEKDAYIGYINKYRKTYSTGYYKTPEKAFKSYKMAKEQHIKDVADKWKGKIADNVYKAMYDYRVEITD